jgi:G:T-mismatch repair DNA endonuclease (very short patch repair protein)
VKTLGGDTLDERYEQTMARIEQINQVGYHVLTQWECEFDEKTEWLMHTIIKHTPLIT